MSHNFPILTVTEVPYDVLLEFTAQLRNNYGEGVIRELSIADCHGNVIGETTIDIVYDAVIKKDLAKFMPYGFIVNNDEEGLPVIVPDPNPPKLKRPPPRFKGSFSQRVKRARFNNKIKTTKRMNKQDIAKIAHELNRAYCQSIGDNSQPAWEDAPDWQKSSAVNGVQFHLDNPDAPPSASHESWLKQKEEEGWKYGPVKDAEKKEHPCCVPYEQLPAEQKSKDFLFKQVVHNLKEFLS